MDKEKTMKNTMMDLLINSLPSVALAVFGGLVHLVKAKDKFSVRMFIGGLLVAVLVGLVLDILMVHTQAPDTMRIVTAVMGGYCSRTVLEKLSDFYEKKISGGLG